MHLKAMRHTGLAAAVAGLLLRRLGAFTAYVTRIATVEALNDC